MRSRLVVAATGVCVLLLNGCGQDLEPVGVDAWSLAAPDLLAVTVDVCDRGAEVAVRESVTAVQLTATAPPQGEVASACLTVVEVRLDSPLGDRTVRDSSTGRTVVRDAA